LDLDLLHFPQETQSATAMPAMSIFLAALLSLLGLAAAAHGTLEARQIVACDEFYARWNNQDATQSCIPWFVTVDPYDAGNLTVEARCARCNETAGATTPVAAHLFMCPYLNYDRTRRQISWSDGWVCRHCLAVALGWMWMGSELTWCARVRFQTRGKCLQVLQWYTLYL
jgi:hypothetical protein